MTTTTTREWNPSEEAMRLANEYVIHCGGRDIIFAGFRDDTKIWFIQCWTDKQHNFVFGELDTKYGTEADQIIAFADADVCKRIGFNGIVEIGYQFRD